MAVPAGVKTFQAGAVLTAEELNTFLMAQVIPVFASEAVAGSAMPSPSDGQFRYLRDVDAFEVFTGSSWVSAAGASVGFEQTFLLMGA